MFTNICLFEVMIIQCFSLPCKWTQYILYLASKQANERPNFLDSLCSCLLKLKNRYTSKIYPVLQFLVLFRPGTSEELCEFSFCLVIFIQKSPILQVVLDAGMVYWFFSCFGNEIFLTRIGKKLWCLELFHLEMEHYWKTRIW